jgi:hypothetical protein
VSPAPVSTVRHASHKRARLLLERRDARSKQSTRGAYAPRPRCPSVTIRRKHVSSAAPESILGKE